MCLDTASTSIGNALACQQGPFLFICQQTLLCSVLWLSLCFLLLCLWQHEAMSRMTEGSQHGGQLRLQCGLLLQNVLMVKLCFLLLCLWQHEAMSRMTEGSQHGGQLRLQCGLLLQNILMIKCPSSQAAKVIVSLAQ